MYTELISYRYMNGINCSRFVLDFLYIYIHVCVYIKKDVGQLASLFLIVITRKASSTVP